MKHIKKFNEINEILQATAIQYLRGYEGKPMSAWVKRGTLSYKAYKEGEYDRKKGLPNRYTKGTE
jgi:hypothetical protein